MTQITSEINSPELLPNTKGRSSFQAFSLLINQYLPGEFHYTTEEELEHTLQMAQQAFTVFKDTFFEERAHFLETIAEEIMALGDVLIERCVAETALPASRITGERGRTCNQLKMFAQLLRDGWWVDARIDTAQPDRQPVPKPDIRRMMIPIGTVAVFGASNFPLAFSTAGGDTASALAAGCPVIVKSHSSHPGTNELVASAISKAVKKTNMPEGVFSSVYLTHTDSIKFVQHPIIKAVGFTGSRNVGVKLFQTAVARPDPIPVYAEMSSVNPVVLLEGALTERGEKIAKDLAVSVTMGVGQFCTNPGLVILLDSKAAQDFLDLFSAQMKNTLPVIMLNRNIFNAYKDGVSQRENSSSLSVLIKASKEPNTDQYEAQPVVHKVSAAAFLDQKELAEEIFGPASLVVICKTESEIISVLQSLTGQLTATVHATPDDQLMIQSVVEIMTAKAGRVIYNGYPTGVEVCSSMQHGGPYPSTTDARSTSVGSAAIYRFVRPVAYQDFPDHLLPQPLQNENPLKILRLVNNKWTIEPING